MTDEKKETVRAVSRALSLLNAMNRQPYSTVQSLFEVTGIPKPTIVRLLKTLVADRYVTNDRRQAGYQISSLVTSLSAGYHGDPLVVEAGRAWAISLNRQFKWPVSIAVLDQNAVVVRYSTVSDSPVSPFHATINMRLSLFTRALGRAYLAHCSPEQLVSIVSKAKAANEIEDELAHDDEALERMVRIVRANGYALRDPRVEPRSSDTVAVPIFSRGRIKATLGMTYFRSALGQFGSFDSIVDALKLASSQIESELGRLSSRGHENDAASPDETTRS